MQEISYKDFEKVEIREGTIIEAKNSDKLNKLSIILKIDFGDKIGIKKSSGQLQANYKISELINKQVAAVINLRPKQIANLISEVLVVGFPDANNQPILLSPDKKVKNGGKLY